MTSVHPHYQWTLDPSQLIIVGLYVVIYLRRFFHSEPSDLEDPFFSHCPRWKSTAWSRPVPT